MDMIALEAALARALGDAPRGLRVERLAGDGSDRRYWRAFFNAGGADRTLVVMDLVGVKNVVKSEEVTLYHPEDGELPFLNIRRFLSRIGAPTPEVHLYDREAGIVLLEDLGDTLLLDAAADTARVETLYGQAVDILAEMHVRAMREPDGGCLAFRQSFEMPLLLWEMRHFTEYGVGKRRGCERTLSPDDLAAVEAGYETICRRLASLPRVFTHRDYHSRNLLLRDGRLFMIDFQDALLGPAVYDLASLLRDSYIMLPDDLVDRLIARYLAACESMGDPPVDPREFRRDFDYQSLQRNLKAAGRFVFFDVVKGNPKFLADIPRTLGYVRANLSKYPELFGLRDALSRYVPELA